MKSLMNDDRDIFNEYAFDRLELKLYPDAVLREVCDPVEQFGRHMSLLMEDLLRFMRIQGGIGLAGPQVGMLQRLFVAEILGDPLCLVNPEIRDWTGQSKMTEGCLSLPGVNVKVSRHKDIDVFGYDPFGNRREYHIGGLWAHVVQHEIDHLDGILISDYTVRSRQGLAE